MNRITKACQKKLITIMKKISLVILSFITVFCSCGQNQSTNVAKNTSSNSPDLPKDLSDSALLDSIEHRTFQYFWQGAEPKSGMAPERIHMDGDYPDKDPRIIATGGSGFGVMAILAGIERDY